MTSKVNSLIEGYRQAANNDIEVIEILFASEHANILIFYHLQQALEKLSKMLYLGMKPQDTTYEKIIKSHNIEDISVELMILIGDEYIAKFKKCGQDDIAKYAKLIDNMELFRTTVKKENRIMKDNFVKNIRNYEVFFNNIYSNFEPFNKLLNDNASAKPVVILSIGALLASSLYKMNNISRYPEEDFNFENLEILRSNMHLIPKLLTMFKFWLDLINKPHKDF
ncbi:MAG: hypothetical protein L0H55_15680 [Candidatus Nitrosocosmicus sp.]|nr:hypothetical protein [Candidatus Nitrosocosmicus sp.]